MSGYLCGVCKKDEKFDPSWTRHLASLCHQRALAKLEDGGHGSLTNDGHRSAKIVGSEGLSATLIQLVEYLTQNGGELQEFICPPGVKPIVVHCLFKEAQSLENLLKVKDPKLLDHKMEIMRNDAKSASESQSKGNEKQGSATKKRKVLQEEEGTKMRCFNGLAIEAQLDKCIEMFGWSDEFISESQKFVNEVVGKMNMKYRKIPFGDLVTGLGLRCRPVLQLLFDIQDIFESSPEKVKSLLQNCHQSIQASRTKSPQKTFPLKKIWIVDKELCIQSVVCNSTATLRLCYSNALNFEECKLFKFYCQFDARILPITFLLAHWATSNNFLQTINQAYPNQLIILMTICFLQHKKVLPTVQNLQEHFGEEEKPIIINGNVVSFCSDVLMMKNVHPNPMASLLKDDGIRAMSLLGLLKDWFDYFSTADLNENAICPRFGYFIPKQDFHPSSVGKLPGDLARVYRFGMGTPNSKKDSKDSVTTKKFLFTQSPLCIQNPFDLSMNSSRGVTSEEVDEFQTGCKEAVKIVAELLITDEPDLTEFILKSVPNFQEIFGNDLKKVKTEPASLTTVITPQKPIYSVPSSPSPIKPITHSTSTTEIQAKASTIKKIQPKEVSSVQKPTSVTPSPFKSRQGAADFFSKTETEENGDNDDGDNDEVAEDDDGMSVSRKTTRFAFPNMNFRPQFNSPTTINQAQHQFSPPRPLINPGLVGVARSRFGGKHYTSEYQQKQSYRPQFSYSSQQSQGPKQQFQYQQQQQRYYPHQNPQTQSYYNNNKDVNIANERILRNPGPQGMRTFFPPKERPNHPQEYSSCFNQNNETCDPKNSEYSNPQLPFHDKRSIGNLKEELGSSNNNYSSFNNTTSPQPLIPSLKKYSTSSSSQYNNTSNLPKSLMSIPKPIRPLMEDDDIPNKLLPNPRYTNSPPEPLFKTDIPSLFPNPKFNSKPNPPPPQMSNQREYYRGYVDDSVTLRKNSTSSNNYSATNDQNRYENYGIQRQNTSQMTANQTRENNYSRLQMQQRQASEELFTRRPIDVSAAIQDFRYDAPTSNYPNVKKSPSKLIPLIDFNDDPRFGMRQYPTHGQQQQRQQYYSNYNDYNQGYI